MSGAVCSVARKRPREKCGRESEPDRNGPFVMRAQQLLRGPMAGESVTSAIQAAGEKERGCQAGCAIGGRRHGTRMAWIRPNARSERRRTARPLPPTRILARPRQSCAGRTKVSRSLSFLSSLSRSAPRDNIAYPLTGRFYHNGMFSGTQALYLWLI